MPAPTEADVSEMAACRLRDPEASPADPRMAAYFTGQHHPQRALTLRTGRRPRCTAFLSEPGSISAFSIEEILVRVGRLSGSCSPRPKTRRRCARTAKLAG
jgi:hypothetical protein